MLIHFICPTTWANSISADHCASLLIFLCYADCSVCCVGQIGLTIIAKSIISTA